MSEFNDPQMILDQVQAQLQAQNEANVALSAQVQALLADRSRVDSIQNEVDRLQREPAPRNISVRRPDPFDGSRHRTEEFIAQVEMFIRSEPASFVDDQKKVLFLTSYLTGEAFRWSMPLMTSDTHGLTRDYAAFKRSLLNTFGDPLIRENAEDKFWKLTQVTSCARYVSEFRRLSMHVNFGEQAMVSKFRNGLKPEIRLELARAGGTRLALQPLMDMASRLDATLFESRQTPRAPRVYHAPAPVNPDAMVIGAMQPNGPPTFRPLSEDQKEDRRRNGLCLYCGKPNHVAMHCPEKRSRGPVNHRAARQNSQSKN